MLKKIIILIFITFLLSTSYLEEYIYDVEIKGISIIAGNVGTCHLKIEKDINNEYEMNIVTQTTNFAKFLYPYVDKIKLNLDKNFSLVSINQNTTDKKQELKIEVNKSNKTIIRNGSILNFYSDTLFTPYSLIHFLRKENISINKKYNYKIFNGKKIQDIILEVLKIEKVKSPYGTFECLNVIPILKKGIKNNGVLELWYTNDEEKIPIKIKLYTKIGTFIMKLKKINKS
tara:strand:+ start:47 stop:736 length:690 start_codon:yes stop_codon:yes gene_type:complete